MGKQQQQQLATAWVPTHDANLCYHNNMFASISWQITHTWTIKKNICISRHHILLRSLCHVLQNTLLTIIIYGHVWYVVVWKAVKATVDASAQEN